MKVTATAARADRAPARRARPERPSPSSRSRSGWFEVPAGLPRERRQADWRSCACSGSARRARSWWTIPVPGVPDHASRPRARSSSTPASTHRSRPSPRPTSAASSPRSRSRSWRRARTSPAQLRSRGIDARDIKTVVMTHLHFDHASAMAEFSEARHSSSRIPSGRPRRPRHGRSCTATTIRISITPSTTAPSASTDRPSARIRPSAGPSTSSATAASAWPSPRATRSGTCRSSAA